MSKFLIKGIKKQEVEKQFIFIKDNKNANFIAQCWPGDSLWIDFFSP